MKNNKYVEFWLEKPEDSPAFLIWQIHNLWQRRMNRALSEVDLTLVQFALLAGISWLERSEKYITQVKLAKHAKTNIMMTSKVVRTLENKDFIIRKECENDTRAKCLFLTSDGYQRLKTAMKIVENIDEEFFKDLNTNSDFLENLNKILLMNEKE